MPAPFIPVEPYPRYRVLAEQGAVYGDFSDYDLAFGQAEHVASPRRRQQQAATIQVQHERSGNWRDLLRLEAGGAMAAAAMAPGIRGRVSALAASCA